MNNMIWDAVLWLRKKLSKDKEDIIEAVNNIQNLFETSADATASSSDILAGKTAYNGTVLLTGTMKDRRGITVTAGATTQDDEYTYLTVPEEACFNANSKLRTKNSNLNKMPGGNSGAPIFQSSNNAGWNDWGNSKSLSYTFTKDYSSVMVYVSGGCSGYGMSSSEDQVKTSMYCNLYPGAGTISCTSGTIIKKNSYYIIQNVRSGSTVTMNFSTSGTQEVAIQAVIWEL